MPANKPIRLLVLSMCAVLVPAVALEPDITPKPLRPQANAIVNLMGALGGTVAMRLVCRIARPPESADADCMLAFVRHGDVQPQP